MTDEYLWDRSGEPDPEVARLERTLVRLRTPRPPLALPENERVSSSPWTLLALAAAATVLLATGIQFVSAPRAGAWTVTPVAGSPRLGASELVETAELHVGEFISTDDHSRAALAMGRVARVIIEPNSTVELVRSHPSEYRLALHRGGVQADIAARPKLFFVNTPSAVTIDLGCRYALGVDDDGNTIVEVIAGLVSVGAEGREVFIPAGATCLARKGFAPGIPRFRDDAPEFVAALDSFDLDGNRATLPQICSTAREKDVAVLYHVMRRIDGTGREAVMNRAAAIVPLPDGVTREGVLRLDHQMLDEWWQAIFTRVRQIRRDERAAARRASLVR